MRAYRSVLGALACLLVSLSVHANVIEVEGPQDSLLGPPEDFTVNHCTLRKAIINANTDTAAYPQCASGSGVDTIVFLSPMTVTFAYAGIGEDAGLTGDLDITDSVIIEGGGSTIDAASLDRIFDINPLGTNNTISVTINNLTLRHGRGQGMGGAILQNGGTLNLNNVTIADSYIFEGDGGAIASVNNGWSPALNLRNCTLTGNHSAFHAGAMAVEGTTVIRNSTIAGNFSDTGLSGGIRNTGSCTLRSSIVANNTNSSMVGYIPNLDGIYISNGYNVIGNLGAAPGNPIIGPSTGDQFGATPALVKLGALANNGGPVLTMALLTGSIAIDKGHSTGVSSDARGFTRPCDLATVANATGGDGADSGAFEVQGLCGATNTNPIANNDFATFAEDSGPHVIAVLANDTDGESDPLTVTSVTQGANGSVAIVGGGNSVAYNAAANFNGTDSFTYTISDGHGGTATGTVQVTVTPVNDGPVATGESYTINQDTVLSVAAPGVLANDTDIDGDTLTAVPQSPAAHGTVVLNANGSFTYTPNATFTGFDSFTYKVSDGVAGSNVVTVNIHVLDTQGPAIIASLATTSLWPVDHSLINVGFSLTVSDNGGASTTNVAVFSDEDDVTSAGGDMSPDAKDVAAGTLRLRAERDAGQDGRVYLIRVVSTDSSANTSRQCLTVVVPKSLSAADVASVNAQANAIRTACLAGYVVGDGPVVGPKQ